MSRLAVLAKNAKEANKVCNSLGMRPEDWYFVADPGGLCGRERGATVLRIKGFYQRSEAFIKNVKLYIQVNDSVVFDIKEGEA